MLRFATTLALVLLAGCGRSAAHPDDAWNLQTTRTFLWDGAHPPSQPALDGSFSLTVPIGTGREVFALQARTAISIGDGVEIDPGPRAGLTPDMAFVGSFGSISVGTRAHLTSVYALGKGPFSIGRDAIVSGYIKTASSEAPAGGDTGGALGLLLHAPPEAEEFRWKIDFSQPTLGSRVARPNESKPEDVSPGRYDAVVVAAGSTVVIRSGAYVVNTFELRSGGTLYIDNLSGPVYLWVLRGLRISGTMYEYGRRPNVLVGYAGTEAPTIATSFRGTLVSPEADLAIPRTIEPHRGAFFARTISVADDAIIQHAPFNPSPDALAPSSVVCGYCALAAKKAMWADCCAETDLRTVKATMSARVCALACPAATGMRSGSCTASCDATAAAAAGNSEAEFADCRDRAWQVFAQCEGWYQYWPLACSRLGFSMDESLACGGAGD